MSEELSSIEVLRGNGGWDEKQAACRQLRQVGTVASVPVLAGLLKDAAMSQFARYALEPMPYAEAGQALIDALPEVLGATKVGVINSLGVRKEVAAVEVLTAALGDADPAVIGAAAVALARIGTRESVRPVVRLVRVGMKAGTGGDLAEAMLTLASDLAGRGNVEIARRLYEGLQAAAWPENIRHAAGAGLARL